MTDLDRKLVEVAAEAIYNVLPYDGVGKKPQWVPGGNSFKQDDARHYAYAALTAALPALRCDKGHDARVPDGWQLVPKEPNDTDLDHMVAELEDDGWAAMLAAAPAPPQAQQGHDSSGSPKASDVVDWAVSRWQAEVANRPLRNQNRRPLDDTWRQIIRQFGGDDIVLCGPTHDRKKGN